VKVAIVTKRLEEVAADALVVGLYAEDKRLPDGLARLDRAAGGQITAVLEAETFKAKAGQVTHVHALGRRVPRHAEAVERVAEVEAEGVERLGGAGTEVGIEASPRPLLGVPDLGRRHRVAVGPDPLGDDLVVQPDERVAGVEEDRPKIHATA